MEHGPSHDFPVRPVEEMSAVGTELVMGHITGPSMMTPLSRRP